MVEIGEVRRDADFMFVPQALRELQSRSIPSDDILDDVRAFEFAWKQGASPGDLNLRFRFQKIHDAECARRGILIYEIYVHRGKYRAVIAWTDPEEPGYWVSFFKKQGDSQSRASLRTAGERAVSIWRQSNGR